MVQKEGGREDEPPKSLKDPSGLSVAPVLEGERKAGSHDAREMSRVCVHQGKAMDAGSGRNEGCRARR